MRVAPAVLAALLIPALLPLAARPGPPAGAADVQVLEKAKLPTDSASLLAYFRRRSHPDITAERMAALVRQLGAAEFRAREQAHAELLSLGTSALSALREPEAGWDAETARRVRQLRRRIEEQADPAVQAATARLIGLRKPAGAAAVLLAYLPFAAEGVAEDVGQALNDVAVRDGKPEPAVLRALQDKMPLRRGAAAEALMRARVAAAVPAVRRLLKDPEPRVRLRAALALAPFAREKEAAREAVATLIDLLTDLPAAQLWAAEDVLVRLAGDQGPEVSLAPSAVARKLARQAWGDWWRRNRDKTDLARLETSEPFLGYTLLVRQVIRMIDARRGRLHTEIIELDRDMKPRWRFDVAEYSYVDARRIGRDRVLVTEYGGQRVTERDLKGNVVWSYPVNGNPIEAQRLPNGNTFIVTANRLVEVDRRGVEVYALGRPGRDILRGFKTRTGEVILLSGRQGTLTRLDPRTGREIKRFAVGQVGHLFGMINHGSIDVLPNGHVLVPQSSRNRVVEFDADGREVWHAAVALPTTVRRLPNGQTLVGSMHTRRLVVLDRRGRQLRVHQSDGNLLFQARQR